MLIGFEDQWAKNNSAIPFLKNCSLNYSTWLTVVEHKSQISGHGIDPAGPERSARLGSVVIGQDG